MSDAQLSRAQPRRIVSRLADGSARSGEGGGGVARQAADDQDNTRRGWSDWASRGARRGIGWAT